MRTNEFTWTDPLGIDHKIQIDIVIAYGDDGGAYLAKTEYYIDSVIDGINNKLRTFCESIAYKCLQMCNDLDIDRKIPDEEDFIHFKKNTIYNDILARAQVELNKQYPQLLNDINRHNDMIYDSRQWLTEKY